MKSYWKIQCQRQTSRCPHHEAAWAASADTSVMFETVPRSSDDSEEFLKVCWAEKFRHVHQGSIGSLKTPEISWYTNWHVHIIDVSYWCVYNIYREREREKKKFRYTFWSDLCLSAAQPWPPWGPSPESCDSGVLQFFDAWTKPQWSIYIIYTV